MSILVPAHIFRAYDIRGRVSSELTEDVVQVIGQAFANEAAAHGTQEVAVAGDVRLSTESLKDALVEGLTHGGVNVIDVGIVPTPVLYFAVEHLNTGAGIVVTGSHNPPEFNGLKFVLDRIPFAGEKLRELHDFIARGRVELGSGSRRTTEILNAYIARICSDVSLARPIRVGIDCGNGVTGVAAPRLFEKLGCEVHSLYSEPDGNFPNHHPDPVKPANLKDLIDLVRTQDLELGIAFDGDGDRLGVVTKTGAIVSADTLMAYYARDVLRQNPNAPIVFDVKCSNALSSTITTLGGQPVMSKTGHTNIKEKIRELGAPLGGEFSGHICFADRWYGFDDALYSAARLLELLSNSHHDMDHFLESIPARYSTSEIEIHATDDRKFDIIEQLQASSGFGTGNVLTIDGLRVDFNDAWGLVRASNTSPNLTMRFEANTPAALDRVQKLFLSELAKVAPDLSHALKT